MNRFAFGIFTLGFVLILSAVDVSACVCRYPDQIKTREEKLNWYQSKSQTVILGKVVSQKNLVRQISPTESRFLGRRKIIRVERFWGKQVSKQVFLEEFLTSCDARLVEGENYLIFVYQVKGNRISTGACSGNIESKYAAEQIKLLGEGKKPVIRKSRKRKFRKY